METSFIISLAHNFQFQQFYTPTIINALFRNKPAISRRCKNGGWPTDLPKASVIFCFHNENLIVLLRSIYSVLMRTPPELLADVIVVDDASTDKHREYIYTTVYLFSLAVSQ